MSDEVWLSMNNRTDTLMRVPIFKMRVMTFNGCCKLRDAAVQVLCTVLGTLWLLNNPEDIIKQGLGPELAAG